tara:strand:+ start:169 stop:465 length:297 start_codon:yes stop_codon:yes gene_type:complete
MSKSDFNFSPGAKAIAQRMWKQVQANPLPKPKTGREILEEKLHSDFHIAIEAAIGLSYDGYLSRQQTNFIFDRIDNQPARVRRDAIARLKRCGIVDGR